MSEDEVIQLLLKQGLITPEALAQAKEETKRTGLALEKALEKLGFVREEDIANMRAAALGVPFLDLRDYLIDTQLVQLIPEPLARKYKVVPLFKISNRLSVAMADPRDIKALDQLRQLTKIDDIEPVLATEKGIQSVLDSCYGAAGSVEEIVKSVDKGFSARSASEDKVETAEEPPIVKLVNIIIMEAVKGRASDIHIEPEEDSLRVRYRIDGVLREANLIPKKMQSSLTSRIKLLAKMDIAENRKPQDGRIRLKMENHDLDIRVSTFPTINGENVVLRLLDKSGVLLGLKELGFLKSDLELFHKLIQRPNGIILVTGPTGSGKTTTLYAALTTISSMEKNIITIEDPVEYELPLIRQTPVNPKAGISFANGLRSILRQDPDIIMVGEIRDQETLGVAVQAALTGHLVFSTLHTNDALSSLVRLMDMGAEPFLISSAVIGILAQRLVRLVCDKCKEKYLPEAKVLNELALQPGADFFRGKGCPKCLGSGFSGRLGIFELFLVGEEIKRMIEAKCSSDEIKRKAVESGMKTLRQDGLRKVEQGLTTPEEVLRVTQAES
jgi:type IV pilus assembly protein PilB